MNVGDLARALEQCYDTCRVQIQINGVFYDIDRIMKLSEVTDRNTDDVIIIRADVP